MIVAKESALWDVDFFVVCLGLQSPARDRVDREIALISGSSG